MGARGGAGVGGAAAAALVAAALLAMGLAGCAREPAVEARPGGWVGDVGADTVSGLVRQIGNVPFHRTVIQSDGQAFAVQGDLESEITRLVGAEIRATGERQADGPFGPELRVTAYEIVSVDGEVPYVGVLERDGEGYLLHTAEGGELRLAFTPLRFEALEGGRVWVTVDERGSVLRYGVLRPPAEMRPDAP